MRKIAFISLAALVLMGCLRARTIPDDKLSDIFCDMFIANAYVEEHAAEFGGRRGYAEGYAPGYFNAEMMSIDSVNFYEPILRNYGYRSRDFIHTLATFSRRKSSRVGDVIDKAIEKLNAELSGYTQLVARLERMDSTAYANTSDTVVFGMKVKAHAVADTAKLKLVYPAADGHYRIEYSYMLDTLDKNYGLRATHYLRDSVGMVVGQNTYALYRGVRIKRSVDLGSSPKATELELKFGNYMGEKISRPNLEVDSILIIHYPPIEVARDIYLQRLLKFETSDFRFQIAEQVRNDILLTPDTLYLTPKL